MKLPPPLLLPAPEPLRDVFPELVEPLKEVLLECEQIEGREMGLVPTVDELEVHGFCGCRSDYYITFYTARPPRDMRGWIRRTMGPLCWEGSPFMSISVVDGAIAEVEVSCPTVFSMAEFKRRYDDAVARAR
jgi:hypothetical protein